MYLGIVVQNNDPKKRGRVKVFIPHLSLNLRDKWENQNANKSFNALSDPYIKDVVDEIKHRLPWANYAAPIVGEVGDHYYNAYSTDSVSKTDNKPASVIESSPKQDNFGNSYSSNSYNDSAKGLFSIPKVGSRVWVFFENGNPNRPVYFATAYDEENWKSINKDSGDYPDKLENFSKRDEKNGETPNDTHKNKMVISQRGAIVEIINTETKESISISQYKGSFKVWNNDGAKELVEGDDKKLVSGNQDLHVGGNMNVFIGGNANVTVSKNATIDIGENSDISVGGNSDITVGGNATLDIGGTYDVSAVGTIDIAAPNINLHGIILLDGPLTQGTVGSQGATMFGPLEVTNDVTAGSVSLQNHTHGGVDTGSGNTAPPN